MKALNELKRILKEEQRRKYPSLPEYAISINTFDKMKPEKREKKRIEAFLLAKGHYAAIIENRGQRIDNRKVITDSIGRQKVIGSVEFIGSGMRRGLVDVKTIINGKPIDVELKLIYKKGRDKQSEYQKREQEMIEMAGGEYWIVTGFEDFYEKYLNIIKK